MTETRELKPCPFCGSTDLIVHDGKDNPAGEYWVGCKCDLTAMCRGSAINNWNTRAVETENKRLREALEEIALFTCSEPTERIIEEALKPRGGE